MKPLQSHSKLTQIQSRLNKQSYLSRSNLPGSADGKMFLYLQSIKRYPDRKLYPNFYHWYVLMKQFSLNSIEKWITMSNDHSDEDLLLQQLTMISSSNTDRVLPDVLNVKKNTFSPQSHQQQHQQNNPKLVKSQDYTIIQSHQIEYIMDVRLKQSIKQNMKQLIMKFLHQQDIEVSDIQQFVQQKRVRIVTKIEPQKFQTLKNKISALQGVQTFQTKKKDKRFKTVNSASNFHADV